MNTKDLSQDVIQAEDSAISNSVITEGESSPASMNSQSDVPKPTITDEAFTQVIDESLGNDDLQTKSQFQSVELNTEQNQPTSDSLTDEVIDFSEAGEQAATHAPGDIYSMQPENIAVIPDDKTPVSTAGDAAVLNDDASEEISIEITAPQNVIEPEVKELTKPEEHDKSDESIQKGFEHEMITESAVERNNQSNDVPVTVVAPDVNDSSIDHEDEGLENEQEEQEEQEELELDMQEKGESFDKMTRRELVELLEEVVKEPDLTSVKAKIALIKVAFLKKEKEEKLEQMVNKVGDADVETPLAETDELTERFNLAFSIYRENRQRYNEEQERQKLLNLEQKKRILEDLRTLINSEETLKKTYDEFRALQEEWKKIGMVPKNEVSNLWQSYHFLVEKFFDKVKINKELKDLDLKKNLERKLELCEKTEELLLETSIIKSFKQLQQYHEEWKEIGPVPQDKKDEIWERFKTASDKINERRREYYDQIQENQEKNHLAKIALCEKAEQLVSTPPETLRQWQTLTNELNELLKIWKTIGHAPKKVNNEIWKRFKAALDVHFVNYKDYLDKLKDQQLNNYNLKVDLCVQAEALRLSTDWKETTRELIRLQKEWKEIGPVPRKHSEKIWKRFRAACDEFFERKSAYFKNLSSVENENLQKKEQLIKQVEAFEFKGSRQENLEALKEFQRQWMEIGFVPLKEKDQLQAAFRTAINRHLDRLKINSAEITAMQYKSRLENLKDQPDAGKVISREKQNLQLKISKLQEDIMLWENNIGFFAESKNASIVKKEFQKKIDQAKQELALLEAKLKYLRES